MKLVYFWVKKFRDFEEEGFNFSSDRKFEYSYETNTISEMEQKTLPKDFYGEKFLDVTGVIGRNGAGKSNVLELTCMLLKGSKSLIDTEFLLIVEDDDGTLTCYCSFEYDVRPHGPNQLRTTAYGGDLDPLNVIYFSNVFDQRKNTFSSKISDLSINRNYTQMSGRNKNSISDFSKQVSFITNEDLYEHLNIDTPNEVLIVNKVWDERPNRPLRNHFDEIGNSKLGELKDFIKGRIAKTYTKPRNKFIIARKYSFCIDALDMILSHVQLMENLVLGKKIKSTNSKKKITNEFIKFVDDNVLSGEKTDVVLKEFINFIYEIGNKYIYDIDGISTNKKYKIRTKDLFNNQIKFINDLDTHVKLIDIEHTKEGVKYSTLEYFTFSFDLISKPFLKRYVALFNDNHFLELGWLGISSGHKAYLNMFASIYHELKAKKKRSDLLICIDEGDLYLHPKWQVEFFDKLLQILPKIYDLGRIQLILTSHSPLLLSNFPKQSTIILSREGEKSIVSTKNSERDTFGGNLYDLYKEQFFLGDMKTSTFADKHINDALNKINEGSFSRQEKDELKKLIDIIGDRVIQYHLRKKLDNDQNF